MKTKVAIFESNVNVMRSISEILSTDKSIEVTGKFSDAYYCVEKAVNCEPDVIVLDIEMPGVKGVDVVKLLNRELPHIQILIQTAVDNEPEIIQCIRAGASGYLQKSNLKQSLLKGIKEMLNGGAPLSGIISRKVLNVIYSSNNYASASRPEDNKYNLTNKEKEVLSNIVNGLSHKMIAADMSISYDTVRNHVKKIYEKLEVVSLTGVVAKAINQQIV
jgi:DNA-binding NarL/FixJ family response regulator